MAITAPTKMTVFGSKNARAIYLPTALWRDSSFPFRLLEELEATIINSDKGTYLIIRRPEGSEKVEA